MLQAPKSLQLAVPDYKDFCVVGDFSEFGDSNDFNDFGELNDFKTMKLFERKLICVLSNELYLVPHTVPLAADLKKKWSQPGVLES